MGSHADIFSQCLQEAARASQPALVNSLDHAVLALQMAQSLNTDTFERDTQERAWQGLLEHKDRWCAQYPIALLAAFCDPAAGTGSSTTWVNSVAGEDETTDENDLASLPLLREVVPTIGQTLAEFNGWLNSARGFVNVSLAFNPVRPEVYTETLWALLTEAGAGLTVQTLWAEHLAEPLARELKRVYEQLIHFLEKADVRSANYRAQTTATTVARNKSAPSPATGMPAVEVTKPRPTPPSAPPRVYVADLPVHAAETADKKDVPPVVLAPMPQALTPVAPQASAPRTLTPQAVQGQAPARPTPKPRSPSPDQLLGMEVVKKRVQDLAQDPLLPQQVREAMVMLQPALLRLIMVDSHFFSEQNLPARRLMAAVAERSKSYPDPSGPAFLLFSDAVSQTFGLLHKLPVVDARSFQRALDQLQQLWDEQDHLAEEKVEEEQRRRVTQFVAHRLALAGQIAQTLQQQHDLDQVPVPVPVLDFLRGPWALVVAHAQLTGPAGQADAEGFEALVADLLWSINPLVTLQRPARLVTMIPALLDSLHAGLATLAPELPDTGAFFDVLEKLHQPALKLRRLRNQRDADDSGAAPLQEDLGATASLPEESPSALRGLEVAELDLLDAKALAQVIEASGPLDPQQTLLSLHEGSWVDLYSQHSWQRAQLVWADPRGTLFMFVSHGGQPHSMTKRSCERLIKDGLLRLTVRHGHAADRLNRVDKHEAPTRAPKSAVVESYRPAGQKRFQPLPSEPRAFEESKL
jgi:hypothetical protein